MSFGFADYDDLFLCRKSWVVFVYEHSGVQCWHDGWWLYQDHRKDAPRPHSTWGDWKAPAFPCMDPPSSLSWPSWGRWWLHKMDLVLPTLSLPWKRHTGIILHCYWLLRRQFGLTFWSSVQIFLFFFSVFFEFWFPDHEVHDFLCWISWHGQIYLHCQAANKTIGQGGFQEVEQMAMFKDSVCYQEEAPFLKWMLLAAFWTEHFMAEHGKIGNSLVPFWRKSCWCLQVRDHTRICEVLNRVIEKVRASIWSICVL